MKKKNKALFLFMSNYLCINCLGYAHRVPRRPLLDKLFNKQTDEEYFLELERKEREDMEEALREAQKIIDAMRAEVEAEAAL